MTPRPLALPFTYAEYLGFPDDGNRHELLEGEHVMTPAPAPEHQQVVFQLARVLGAFLRERKLGRAWPAPIDVLLSPVDVVQPDLAYVAETRSRLVTRRGIEGAPDLVVEVLSPGTRHRDEVTKRFLYGRHGVAEYWLADPETATLRIFSWSETGYRDEDCRSLAGEALVTSPLLPGLEFRLAELFGA